MAHPIHCDPRTLLKQLAIPLVQRLFEQRGELLDLPWSEIRQKKQTAPIYAAWQRLLDDRRREVQIVFHEIRPDDFPPRGSLVCWRPSRRRPVARVSRVLTV
jgi:hypothetical protein